MKEMLQHIIRWLKDPYYHFGKLWYRLNPDSMPDKWFLSVMWQSMFGYKLDWKNPKTLNEKLQWLKLYDRNPLYTTLVDKYAVKQYIAEKIGPQYVIPTLAVYDSVDEIDLAKLPDRFVLKCTHDSGSVIICHDKSSFDLESAKAKLAKALTRNYYLVAREWPYKHVPHRIIAEEYLESGTDDLYDYKFFCFNGEVKCFKVDFNRHINHRANYYDLEGHLLPFGEIVCPRQENALINIPDNIKEMIAVAEVIAKEKKFVRIDLYNLMGGILFSECTFFPAGGWGTFSDEKWDETLGSWATLK